MPTITLDVLANTVLDQAAQITELRDERARLTAELAAAHEALHLASAVQPTDTPDEEGDKPAARITDA
jgi:hypothetical protein